MTPAKSPADFAPEAFAAGAVRRPAAVIAIIFPTSDQIRSRRVVTRSRARATGKFPSWKMGRMVEWESVHELRAFRLLDADPAVTQFHEQPCEIRYTMNGTPYRHFPDVLVETTGGKEIWEIKPESKASAPDVQVRTELLRDELVRWGYVYRLVTSTELAREPQLKNASTLLRFGRRAISEIDHERFRLQISKSDFVTWADAISGGLGFNGRQIICRLTLEGSLRFNANAPISLATTFYPVKGRL